MYLNNLKKLRIESELTQEEVSKELKKSRNTYKNWENGLLMIPLEYADQLSLFYNVRLSYILGIDKEITTDMKIKKMDYKLLLKNLNKLKENHKNSYEEISTGLSCAKSTCHSYFTGKTVIPIDRLILLSQLYEVDLDKLCGKE